jgi:hypothetical protein
MQHQKMHICQCLVIPPVTGAASVAGTYACTALCRPRSGLRLACKQATGCVQPTGITAYHSALANPSNLTASMVTSEAAPGGRADIWLVLCHGAATAVLLQWC